MDSREAVLCLWLLVILQQDKDGSVFVVLALQSLEDVSQYESGAAPVKCSLASL